MVAKNAICWYSFYMRTSWNKGLTRGTHPSVLKISETMRRKKLDNFKGWRDEMKRLGKIKSEYSPLEKNGDLAELIGVILGDGHICVFPRTECLRIVSNSNNAGFLRRYSGLVYKVFRKKPSISKRKSSNAVDITIYEKRLSQRLDIPAGARGKIIIYVPRWIFKNNDFLIRYLRGLYEAEGSYSVHLETYTHKLLFSNCNNSLLTIVEMSLKKLGFHPHRSHNKIQVSRKQEVQELLNLLQFRRY